MESAEPAQVFENDTSHIPLAPIPNGPVSRIPATPLLYAPRTSRSLVKNIILGKNYTSEEKAMGLTDPKPDLTHGIQKPEVSPIPTTRLKMKCQAWRSVIPGMQWPFFFMEHKGCEDSIAQAENQAIRDEAVLMHGISSTLSLCSMNR